MYLLLVEDDPTHAMLMRARLAQLRADVLHVATVSQAIQALAAASEFDLVLLDQQLPDGRGVDVHAWMRANGSTVPVVFVTAEGDTDAVVRAARDGARGYVVKRPGYLEQLETEVTRVVHGDEAACTNTRARFEDAERRRLSAALARHAWNVSATARALGMGRGKLRSRMSALGIDL